jgi:hypothetical protein
MVIDQQTVYPCGLYDISLVNFSVFFFIFYLNFLVCNQQSDSNFVFFSIALLSFCFIFFSSCHRKQLKLKLGYILFVLFGFIAPKDL